MTLNMQQIHRWVTRNASAEELIPTQLQQIGMRILFGLFTALYVWTHSPQLADYLDLYWVSIASYFIINIFFLISLRRRPLSIFRTLFGPFFDVTLVAVAMCIDGGQASNLYPLFIIIVLGNGLRFGNAMLIYTQSLSIAAVILVSIITAATTHHGIDIALLLLQCLIMLVTPFYSFRLSRISEEAIQERDEAEQTSFGLLDHGPLPAFTYKSTADGELQILYANSAMQQIYGDSISELVGEPVNTIALHEDGEELFRACMHALGDHNEAPHRFYFRGRQSSENVLRLLGHAMRIHWHGEIIGVCFLLDITQSETLRNDFRQSTQSGYMSTLVAGIVHDFRNVLTGIIGTAEVMQFSAKEQEIQEQLALIMSVGERGSEMITHLLNLSKPAQQETQTIDTAAMYRSLTSIVGLLRIQLPAYITLDCTIDEKLPAISVDITQMEEIISNLVNNASQAICGNGNIRITLSAESHHPLATTTPVLRIEVTDDGCGIPEKHLEKITKPFWTSRETKGGTGLGLAMVERIINHHRGKLLIDSTLGEGTTVTIYLPPADAKDSAIKEVSAPADAAADLQAAVNIRPCSVLLVDDTPEVLMVHQCMLERMGHRVVTANNAIAGLDYFKQHHKEIDMLVSDFRMPGMDGMDFAIAVREIAPTLPIIIITAYGEAEKLQRAHSHSVKVLNKPITYKNLMQELGFLQEAHGIQLAPT